MRWKIFIITHGPIVDDYYSRDPLFSNENFVFLNVSNNDIKSDKYSIINKNEFEGYIHLGKWYAEGEAIYSLFKQNIYADYDYIGFIHWDYELLSENNLIGSNITSIINNLINHNEDFISFSTFTFSEDYNQKIMMDINYPNNLTGDGKNCWDEIIQDYNLFFNKDIDYELLLTKRINLCSAFLCKKEIFEDLMSFISYIVESKKLEAFDTDHLYRFQGGMLERYIGCYSFQHKFAELPLYHHSNLNESTKISFWKKIKSLIN